MFEMVNLAIFPWLHWETENWTGQWVAAHCPHQPIPMTRFEKKLEHIMKYIVLSLKDFIVLHKRAIPIRLELDS